MVTTLLLTLFGNTYRGHLLSPLATAYKHLTRPLSPLSIVGMTTVVKLNTRCNAKGNITANAL